ncbi:uncharacterized [Tachysurus ichikawai]
MYLWLTVGLTPLLEPGYFEKIDEFLPYRGRDSSREGVETFSLNELSLGRGVFHRVCFKELSQKQLRFLLNERQAKEIGTETQKRGDTRHRAMLISFRGRHGALHLYHLHY